jgi:CheY-like chemotaxis protein
MSRSFYETPLAQREPIEAVDLTSGQPAVFVNPIPKLPSSTARLDDQKFSTRDHGPKLGPQRTVFYVDENPKALRLLTFVLEGCGYKVVTASNLAEVFVGTRQTSCNLALLACRRPQTICSNLLLAIKQHLPDVPIVLISAYTLLTPVELIHVSAHVGKGASLDDLLLKIQELTRKTKLQKGAPR